PQPGAWTTHNGAEVKIFDSRLGDVTGKPGEVVDLSADGATVAAGEGAIVIKRVRGAGAKVPIAEYAAETGLKAGDILGS
ncbi:MAG TPA: methionyl-tRNA formyltransferase, partial [Afifellaceae bacterium]|nr:methionyl-tRNA formyltransferase [Afifellaceae bacterium]